MILVLGQARSGTSAVAGICHHLGVHMGDIFEPADKSNPEGYYTDWLMKDYHLQMRHGIDCEQQYKDLISKKPELWGMKDHAALPVLDTITKYFTVTRVIRTKRDVNESAVSLAAKRCNQDVASATRFIQQNVVDIERYMSSSSVPVLDIDYLELQKPAEVVAKIAKFLGLSLTTSAVESVKPKLRRTILIHGDVGSGVPYSNQHGTRTKESTLLSVVMAAFVKTESDRKDVIYTVQSATTSNRVVGEVVVVNNNPDNEESKKLRAFLNKNRLVKYIEFPEPKGTAAPRDKAIRSASNKFVVCIDSHVILRAGAALAIERFWQTHPDKQNDFVQGPILNESMDVMATSFKDVWGVDETPQGKRYSEMWGQWHKDTVNGKPRHEVEPLFEIPAQGLGLFSVNRETWLGFNPHMIGFGGEEFYIHEKYRKAGRKCWCLSQLQWWHLFGEPKTYPLQRGHKCRNYVLGLTELGIPLDRAYEHFVASKLIPQQEWDRYVAEANSLAPKPAVAPPGQPPESIQVQNTRISRSNFPALQAAATAARAYRLQHPCGELGLPLENTVGCRGMKKHKCGKALHGGAVCPAAECIACASYDDVGPASTEADA